MKIQFLIIVINAFIRNIHYLCNNDFYVPWAATSGTLAALMGKRFYNSRKIMPAGIVAGARYLNFALDRLEVFGD